GAEVDDIQQMRNTHDYFNNFVGSMAPTFLDQHKLASIISLRISTFNVFSELTWDKVLSRVTKHFSDEFSQFCDRKMSDFVWMLCWNRVWPEPLLLGFGGASKSVWLVHLLANSMNPGLQIFRVEKDYWLDLV
ncbi:hypothetical protein IGI04_040765, partial [Brassica rapa subsp. trilocularis]